MGNISQAVKFIPFEDAAMVMEVYDERYAENCWDRYWEKEKKLIPYMVLFPSNVEMYQFERIDKYLFCN